MKKYFYALTAALMALTSCSSDEEVMKAEVDEPTTVTISAYLPDYVKSRVTTDDKNIPGQGNKIAKIEYAILDQYGKIIYHSGQTGAVQPEKDANDHGHYTFTVELLKNHKYHFYLWASAATSPYTFIPEAGTVDESGTMTGGPRVTMDYSKVKANDESMDAFFGMHTYTIDNEKQANDERYMITLTRPFAQLNILINDKETIEKIENNTHSRTIESITVKVAQTPGRYQSLNLHSFVASNPLDAAFTFTAAYPNGWDDLVHAGDGDVAHYYYLATCYLLTGISPDGTTKGKVGAAKELTDLEITIKFTDETFVKINKSNVPIRRNWRTDIYGALLTIGVDVNCRIDFEFSDKYQDGPGASTGTGSDDGDHSNDNNSTDEDL